MGNPGIRLVSVNGARTKAANAAQSYRLDAARMLREATEGRPISDEDALELIDLITLAVMKGLEECLTGERPPPTDASR